MKNLKRLFTLIVSFALLASFMVIAPVSSIAKVYAAESNVGAVLTIRNFNSTGEVWQTLTIPKGSSTNGTVEVIIKDPRNKLITSTSTNVDNYVDNGTSISFKPKQIGYYTVEYKVSDGITRSQIYSIYVSGTKPTISFEDNAEVYIPHTVYDTKEVELPLPIVTDNSGEKVEDLGMFINTGINSESATGADYVLVSATDPKYKVVNLYRNDDNKICFMASKDGENYVYGTYTLVYSYQDSTSGLMATKYVTIEVEKDYKENVADKVDMTFVWENGKSLPTSGTLGEELVLPKPIAQDKNQSNAEIQVYTQVEVNFVPQGDLDLMGDHSYTFNYDNFSFIPMDKTEKGGYYRVKYTITDYFGNHIEKIYTIKNVTDSVEPTIYLVDGYDLEDARTGTLDLTDISNIIPHKIIINCEQYIILPAIYAVDKYVKDFDKLTLSRYFIDGSNTSYRLDTKTGEVYNTNEKISINYADGELDSHIKDCLKKAGTYKIEYRAYDGEKTAIIPFELIVLESFVDETAPRITMPTIDKTAFAGDTITFKVPTVVDWESASLQAINVDTLNCQVEIGYYYGTQYNDFYNDFLSGKELKDCTDNAHFKFIDQVEDNKDYYSFEIPEGVANVYVLVRAFDRAVFGNPNGGVGDTAQNNIAVEVANIRVVTKDALAVAPAFDLSQIDTAIEEIAQNAEYKIVSTNTNKEFIFTGANSDFTVVSINVYDPNGNEVSVRGASTIVNSESTQISVEGAYFTTTKDGEYVITITATDYNGTSTVVAYKVTVKDTIPPMLNVELGENTTVIVGEEFLIPDCIMMDNGEESENKAEVSIDFRNQDNPRFNFVSATNKFTALEEGTFTFVYRVSDGVNDPVEKTITLTAIAGSNKNELSLSESNWEISARLKPILNDQDEETGKYTLVAIPYLDAINAVKGIKNYKVTVKNSNNKDISIVLADNIEAETEIINCLDRENLYGAFEPTSKDGKYTITYVVEDNAGHSYTLEKTLVVGDQEKPTLVIANANKNLPSSMKVGDPLDIDYADFTFEDEVTKNKSDFTFTVSIKDNEGKVTDLSKNADGHYTYNFEKAGTYTLTYTLTDKAGNSDNSHTTTIKVSGEGANSKNVTTVIAGVLIALFVALCAGIIVYFVLANKKAKSDKQKENARQTIKNN